MTILITPGMEALRAQMWAHANSGLWNGRENTLYFQLARRLNIPTGTSLLFTRDIGHHTSGWWKNPDYERCYHLSLSFHDLDTETNLPFEPKLAEAWVRCFYRDWVRYIWEESGVTPGIEVRHYRVFCDPAWQPILPRGEVYSRELTEAGWKSWSDARYAEEQAEDN